MEVRRYYRGKAVNFILLAKIIATSFKNHITELAGVDTDFTPEKAADLELDVDTIAGLYLGNIIRDRLYSITFDLETEIADVKSRLGTLKTHLDVDFRRTPEYDIILNELGLKGKSVHNLSQPQLIVTLSKIKNTLTPEYITKITAHGMPATLPQGIAASAKTIIDLNNEQETIKGSVKEAIGKMREDLNDLYLRIIKICRLAANFYNGNPEKKYLFIYDRVMRNMGGTRTSTLTSTPTSDKSAD